MYCNRTHPLSAVIIPVLELRGDVVTLRAIGAVDADGHDANTPAEAADLPTGFRELWLRASSIDVQISGHAGSAPVSGIDIAEELCRFLALAPQSYRAFRLYEYRHEYYYTITVSVPWISLSLSGSNGVSRCAGRFDSLQDMATAMQRFADGHSLAVSLSDDQTYVLLMRVGA